ncbi:MAG TPA: Smr/MutS family protein [Steroidobacteraceae bacterium]|nr:Smr/MutS family protein [Steroidobacteraceae bacterium]
MKPKPDEDESALFREATRGVKPLTHAARVANEAPDHGVRTRVRRRRAEPSALLDDLPHAWPDEPEPLAGDPSLFARPGVPQATLRKLRRGQYRIQGELDLHGLTVAEARAQLREFLGTALRRHARCLRIVHGKGLRSGSRGAVLRQLVNGTLRHTAPVLAFASARAADGGTGAVYVLLGGPPQASSASTTA